MGVTVQLVFMVGAVGNNNMDVMVEVTNPETIEPHKLYTVSIVTIYGRKLFYAFLFSMGKFFTVLSYDFLSSKLTPGSGSVKKQ